jgi:glycosyltransferase involved in cell wall biosynthesis
MRDGALVQALRRAGEDVVMVPMYLPMFTDGNPLQDDTPVFFGGINVWLQQQVPLFRKTPRWMDRLFDSEWMLRRAARMEGTTSASELGPMTLSMLEGTGGHQKKELERLLQWLQEHERPDLVHISNALLIGLAGEIKERMNIPVVCSLQDEDWWLDAINPPYDQACWDAIRARTDNVDRFVAVSGWFADRMSRRLEVPRDLMDVVHVGIDLSGYEPAPLDWDPPVLGIDDAEFIEDFSREKRLAFLKSISVMCVPVEQGEAFGSYIIEAMAAGVPVVQPDAGAFPELIEQTGGGLVYEDPVRSLGELLLDPDRARELGSRGRRSVQEHFSIETMAQNMMAVYNALLW